MDAVSIKYFKGEGDGWEWPPFPSVLRTYETKMAARTGKRSILTLIRKTIGNYVKSTRLRTNSFERMEINPNSIKYAIL